MQRVLATFALATCALWSNWLLARSVEAQELSAYGTAFIPDNDLLGTPVGIGGSFTWHFTDRVGVRLGFARAEDSFSSFGRICPQFVPCDPEDRSETGRVDSLELSVPFRLYSTPRMSVALVPGVGQFHFVSQQRGQDSGRVRSSAEDVTGVHLALEFSVLPFDSSLLGLTLGAFGASTISTGDLVLDAYRPFDDGSGFAVPGLRLGATVNLAELMGSGG